ncbi:MAG: fatty acid desaturase family protein [Bdellovibrionota bacterium]
MSTSKLPPTKIKHRNAEDLAAGYSGKMRVLEWLAIFTFLAFSGTLIYRLSPYFETHASLLLSALLLGWLGADFVSGLVHWAGDTWGSPEMPVLGQSFVRTFREHHVDQLSITRHDFVEVNGSNCLVSLPVLLVALLVDVTGDGNTPLFGVAFMTSLTLWVFLTNQIHKWAHQENPSRAVRFLQRTHLILGAEHHSIHHAAPYDKYYCITTGWLNGPLHAIGFYRRLERLITRVTCAIPRADDIGKSAALAIDPSQQHEKTSSSPSHAHPQSKTT